MPITVLTMIFKGPVKSLYLKLSGHPGHTFALRQIGVRELGFISNVPLSTFARAFGGRFCIEHYVAFAPSGKSVVDSRRPCG
jgi:hypothetical protein